jgi:hypothetical protein
MKIGALDFKNDAYGAALSFALKCVVMPVLRLTFGAIEYVALHEATI